MNRNSDHPHSDHPIIRSSEMLKLPRIIGHRGCAAYAPENTLEGIHTAADMGVEWVELDVKLTKDDVPIIFHDETLERTTQASGNVADMTLDDLRQLEAGSWFADSFTGIKIPTLEEAVDVLLERDLGLNLEIKPCPGREVETAEIALDVLANIWDEHDRLLISSFQHPSLEAARDMANDWARGLLIAPAEDNDGMPENWQELADYLDVKTMNLAASLVTRELVEEIAGLDMPTLAFTINQPDEARAMQACGVDTIFSDAPDVVKEGLFSVH